jgi:acyl-CoA thioesterase-1
VTESTTIIPNSLGSSVHRVKNENMVYIKYMQSCSLIIVFFAMFMASCNNSQPAADNKQPLTPGDSVIKVGKEKTILFFGNSITAGYGLNPSEAFPSLIQHRLDSLNLSYKVVNAGVSGETTSGGMGRIEWILKQPPDIFVLELGANDGLRGIQLSETKKNLQSIIDQVKLKNPGTIIILAGMQIPPNMGQKYAGEFRDIYPDLAKKNGIHLVPFLLEGVGG